MVELLWKRPDGSFVARVNDHPYHVIEGDEPLWSLARSKAMTMGLKLKLEPAPGPSDAEIPALTKLPKAELWRRCTDEEAEALADALSQAPLRLQMIFQAAQYLDTTDADYPALRAGVVAALGEERAGVVLAPTEF